MRQDVAAVGLLLALLVLWMPPSSIIFMVMATGALQQDNTETVATHSLSSLVNNSFIEF